jgi:hypothetical protein
VLIDEWSYTLPVEKLAKVPKWDFTPMVNPAAIPIMFLHRFGKNALGDFKIVKF